MFNDLQFILLILLIVREQGEGLVWSGAHVHIFYKLKSKIGKSRDEGPDVSEQIAVC